MKYSVLEGIWRLSSIRQPEPLFKFGRIGFKFGSGPLIDDAAPLQDDGPIGQGENLSGVLLDDEDG